MEIVRDKNVASRVLVPMINSSSRPDYLATAVTSPVFTAQSFQDGQTAATLATTSVTITHKAGGLHEVFLPQAFMNPDSGNDDYIILKISGGNCDEQAILIRLKPVQANLKEIEGDATDGNNATLKLKRLEIIGDASSEEAVLIENADAGHSGMRIRGLGTSHGLHVEGGNNGGNGVKIDCQGGGSGDGINCTAGATGNGAVLTGDGSGDGLKVQGGEGGIGLHAIGGETIGHGAKFSAPAQGGNGYGLLIERDGGASGSAVGAAMRAVVQNFSGQQGSAVELEGDTTGHGLHIQSGDGADGDAILAEAQSTNGHGAYIKGTGTKSGAHFNAAGTQAGMFIDSVSGPGLRVYGGTNSSAIFALGNGTGFGLNLKGGETGHGVYSEGGDTTGDGGRFVGKGTSHGIHAQSGGGASGNGINAVSLSTGGHGINAINSNESGTGSGIYARSGVSGGNGIDAASNGGNGHGILAASNGNGNALKMVSTGSGAAMRAENQSTGRGIEAIGSSDGVYIEGGQNSSQGHGIHVVGGESVGSGTFHALYLQNQSTGGNGDGLRAEADNGGIGIYSLGGSSGGAGAKFEAQNGDAGAHFLGNGNAGIYAQGQDENPGIWAVSGSGATGDGILAQSNATNGNGMKLVKAGSGRDIFAAEIGAAFDIDGVTGAGVLEVLKKFADDNGGADFDATTDSLEKISTAIGSAGLTDWTATEKANIRHALGINGTKTAPTGGYGRIGNPIDLGDGANSLVEMLTGIAGKTANAAGYLRANDSLEAIRDRGDAAWASATAHPDVLEVTTITGLSSQTVFNLTAGSADDDAYNGAMVVITDASTSVQKAVADVASYVGATKTITLLADPGIFTIANGDNIAIIAKKSAMNANIKYVNDEPNNDGVDWDVSFKKIQAVLFGKCVRSGQNFKYRDQADSTDLVDYDVSATGRAIN